jgi:spermidine synthase
VARDETLRVGIIGLGAGTIATYGQPGDQFRFYEINPDVEQFARKYFSFLEDSQADVQVVLGDARLSMEQESPQEYDVLVLDAFSGDAIPAHLLTQEAFEIYLRHLKPNGVIAANISNRHLDLEPVVENLGAHFGFQSASFSTHRDAETFRAASHWIVLSKNSAFWDQPDVAAGRPSEIGRYAGIPMWTDQFNNLFQVLK